MGNQICRVGRSWHADHVCRVGRSWHADHVCSFNLPSVSYSFWNKGRKVLKFWKLDEKREITPKWVMGFTSKLQGR